MIPELGHVALMLALAASIAQAILPLVGAQRGDPRLMAVAAPAAHAQFAMVALAFLCLTWSYVTSDFSVVNVAQNSHTQKPLLYKITGVWGNHEGSLLLWVFILAVFGSAVAAFGGNLPLGLKARALSIQAMIAVAFLAFMILTSNPFLRIDPAPIEGRDLNPILQDPGLAFHPPFLYLGYVGFSIVFSFAVAALIEGRVDAAWARWVRPWTLAAWASLTLGIALGSWWAYYELGWGGWWYWDPVENASFMPWLVGAALLHSALVAEKRDALKTWTILLAILAFALSLIGTFIVRSGVITSVHSFASDPARGVFILGILVVAIGGSLALYAWRAPQLRPGGVFAPVSREGALVLNNLLLATACATVFIGTLYPLFHEGVTGGKLSIGAPFFNATFVPLMLPLIAAMAVGPLLAWKRGDLPGALRRLWFAAICAAASVAAALALGGEAPVLAYAGLALAAMLAAGAAIEFAERIGAARLGWRASLHRARNLPRAAWGATIAHLGVAVCVAGMVVSSAWQAEAIRLMKPGESLDIAGWRVTFMRTVLEEGPNYTVRRGYFEARSGGGPAIVLSPAKRYYPSTGMITTEAAIRTSGFADLYITIADPSEGSAQGAGPRFLFEAPADAAWAVRITHNPLVPWIWIGAGIMAFGGLVSLSDRRLRVGAPARAKLPKNAAPAE
ncbi:MAG: heme lyase CcmF/NrfE family subunit [Alphaproteobacteria bacterium]|nr:heme lyase CcmF/NrfE family subunit [Alphaproteobacteria bacterium]